MPVDVLVKMYFSVFIGQRSRIHDKNGYWSDQFYRLVVIVALHRIAYPLDRPTIIVAQCPRGELDRLLNADTTVAKVTSCSREQFGSRRAVQIDIELIREHQFHQAKSIRWSRF